VVGVDKPEVKDIALRVVIGGKARDVTYQELVLSNNLAQESLVRLLIRKKVVDAQELLDEMQAVRRERYRPMPEDKKNR